jgi:hypothetical protein
VYNPDGLHYSSEQIDYLLANDAMYMYNFAIDRENKSYEELQIIDQLENNWENATNQYNQHFETYATIRNKQRGYSIIGILGLITCIATIGIILYGYILFYK